MDKNIMGNNIITQVAILVNDIEKTLQAYCDFFGIENPGYIVTDTEEKAQTKYNGVSTPAQSKLAFVNAGSQLVIELIEPDKNPSVWREYLDKNGEGFHHIAFSVNGMKTVVQNFEKNGMPEVQKGEYTGGRYSYIDAFEPLKLMIELLEND